MKIEGSTLRPENINRASTCPGGEMVYAIGLGPIARKSVEVRLLSRAPKKISIKLT